MDQQRPRPATVAVDDMQLAAYLISRGQEITCWQPKPGGRYVWAMFDNSDEFQRLRRAYPRSPEFMAFGVYNDLLAQVKTGNGKDVSCLTTG